MAKKFLAVIRIMSADKSRVHLVDREKFTVGRSAEVEILLVANSISRKHLAIEVRDQSILIEDLGSSNGSFLNGIRLDAGKKYPVPERAPIRLGQSNEILTIELMERPVEFDQYHSFLPKFNNDLQAVMEQMSREAQGKADAILKEAQKKADYCLSQAQSQAQMLIQKVKVQEESSLEVATSKASQVIKEAEAEARQTVEQSRAMALSEAEAIRNKAQQESEALSSQRLNQVREEVQRIHMHALTEAREKASREVESEFEVIRSKAREQVQEIKIQAQVQADQILQDAHKESARVKETGIQDFEKMRADGQKRAQALLSEAEKDSEKILLHAREASEKMRQSAQADFDELQARSKTQAAEIVQHSESEAQLILENARKRAHAIIENQEKESALILSELGARIQREAQKEAQRLLKETEGQIEESKAQARKEVLTAQELRAQIEEKISALSKELGVHELSKKQQLEEMQKIQNEVLRLKEDNEKQSYLNAQLDALEKHIKALEMQKIQMTEKNAKTLQEFEMLKKNTFDELERVRLERERQILEMPSTKAKEFSQRIEKVIIGDINRALSQKLDSSQLSEISRKVSDELITLFASESMKRETKAAHQAIEAAPGFTKSPFFRWGLAGTAVLAVVVLIKTSNGVVKQQVEYTNNLIEQQKEDLRFKPKMTNEYRGSYTDNILYMDRYVDIKNDAKVQDQWALNLNEFFISELKLSEENMVRFIGIESALLKRLTTLRESVDAKYLEEGINRMREVEKEEVGKILQVVQTQANYNRLRTREKIFIAQVAPSVPVVDPTLKAPPPESPVPVPTNAQAAPGETVKVEAVTQSPAVAKPEEADDRRKPAARRDPRGLKKRPFPYR